MNIFYNVLQRFFKKLVVQKPRNHLLKIEKIIENNFFTWKQEWAAFTENQLQVDRSGI